MLLVRIARALRTPEVERLLPEIEPDMPCLRCYSNDSSHRAAECSPPAVCLYPVLETTKAAAESMGRSQLGWQLQTQLR